MREYLPYIGLHLMNKLYALSELTCGLERPRKILADAKSEFYVTIAMNYSYHGFFGQQGNRNIPFTF